MSGYEWVLDMQSMCSPYKPQQAVFERLVSPYELEVEMPEIMLIRSSPPILVRPPPYMKIKILGWKTIPQVVYPIPKLLAEEIPLVEQNYVTGLIEADGSLYPAKHRRYLRPVFYLAMKTKPPVQRAGKALGLTVREYPPMYVIKTSGTPAISISHWALAYLTPNSVRYTQAKDLLKMFARKRNIKLY